MTLRPFSADLQKQFRDTLGTPGAPEVIDDGQPVMPVAVVAQVNTATSASYTQITDGVDTVAVNTDGSINTTPVKKTLVPLAGTQSGLGTTTLGTVPASKVWRVLTAWVSATGGVTGNSNVELNSIAVVGVRHSATTINGSNTTAWNYDACPVLTAGQTATLNNTAASASTGGITYIEETA